MLVAALVASVGLLSIAAITQRNGLRLGGTVVAPVLAIYTLKNVITLPVFLGSALLAYVGLSLAKRHTLLYGRDELVVAILVGSAVPTALLAALEAYVLPGQLREIVFFGSVLPGLTAFNYHQLKPGYRAADLATAASLFVGLVALGGLLVDPGVAGAIGGLTPPVLFAGTADVAQFRGAVVDADLAPVLLDRHVVIGLLVLGFLSTEAIRGKYGIRTGVVSFALLAIYALASRWLIVLWLVLLVLAFLTISAVQWATLLYGRVLIGIGTGLSLLYAVPLVVALPVVRGLSAFFVALLAGINAYNVHVTPPRERLLWVPLVLAVSLPMVLLARWLAEPYPAGIPQELGAVEVGTVAVVLLACLAVVRVVAIDRPSDDAVFSASVLSGGGEQ